jgi:hypothetical protein
MPTVPNMHWVPSPPHHQEWSALGKNHPGVALLQRRLGAPADVHPEVGPIAIPSLPEYLTPTLPAQSPAKNILALVTAAGHSNAPVLEFRLQTDDDALMACHRVQAFVFNQVRHCPASPPPCFPTYTHARCVPCAGGLVAAAPLRGFQHVRRAGAPLRSRGAQSHVLRLLRVDGH